MAAEVYNYWFADPTQGNNINYLDTADFTAAVQMARDGDVKCAKNIVDAANNLGCLIDTHGNFIR